MDGLKNAYAWDIKARIADQNLNPAAIESKVTEIKEGVVYDPKWHQGKRHSGGPW